MSLGEILADALAARPDAIAVVDGSRRLSYAQLEADSDAIAGGLASSLGVKPSDRVGLMLPNGYDFIRSYLGIVKAGAAAVPVNVMLKPAEVGHILGDSGAVAVITGGPLAEAAGAAARDLPALRHIICAGEGPAGSIPLDELAGQPPHLDIDESSHLAAIIYTSGTTGRPKGACLSHHNILSNVSSCGKVLGCTKDERFLCVLPMFHAFAMTTCVLLPLSGGGTCVSMKRFSAAAVLRTIADERVTVFAGVPSMYAVLCDTSPPEGADLSSWRLAVSGGAAMPPALMKRFEDLYGVPIVEGDGPTECSPVTSVNPPEGPRKPGSIGKPIPDVQMKIVDRDGRELSVGQVGEIVVRGPNVMVGYWNNPEATAQAMRGGWFHTGDLGYVDEDGYFYIVDRLKDMIIHGGMNIYPREIEEVLYSHEAIAEAAVVGKPHGLRGEVPVAFVTLRPGAASVDPQAIIRFCNERLASYKVPKEVHIVDELPKTATGKILKRALKEPWSDSSPGAGA